MSSMQTSESGVCLTAALQHKRLVLYRRTTIPGNIDVKMFFMFL